MPTRPAILAAPFFDARVLSRDFTHPIRGIGLGLAVVKRLLEANGGQITVESTLGQGSRFLVRFPRASEDS